MTKKNKSGFNKTPAIIAVIVIFIFSAVLLLSRSFSDIYSMDKSEKMSDPKLGKVKNYHSDTLDFSISFPYNFEIEDKLTAVYLRNELGNIDIVRNGTNYKSLSEYLENFDSKRKLTTEERIDMSINGEEAISRIILPSEQNVKQKSYYIYINNAVYIISTTSEALYDDLDRIAQSFRYTP